MCAKIISGLQSIVCVVTKTKNNVNFASKREKRANILHCRSKSSAHGTFSVEVCILRCVHFNATFIFHIACKLYTNTHRHTPHSQESVTVNKMFKLKTNAHVPCSISTVCRATCELSETLMSTTKCEYKVH